MFSVASPFTLVELLKICLSVAVIKTCVCFSLEFCCVAGACQDPNSSSFLGETRSLQVSDCCPKGMTSFLTQYVEFSELSHWGREVVSEICSGESWAEGAVSLLILWLVFSLEMALALSPLRVSGLHPSGSALDAVLFVKHLPKPFQSSSVWISLSFGHMLHVPVL